MRCLTLANELRDLGVYCHFICRDFPGHEGRRIQTAGHGLSLLPVEQQASWLGASLRKDSIQTAEIVRGLRPNWLVVDHYYISNPWFAAQREVRPNLRILVMDDMADRSLDCDVLLDSTHGRNPIAYNGLIPPSCTLLLGADYALLRPEFAALRTSALARRAVGKPDVPHLLISLGGGDTQKQEEAVYAALTKLRKIVSFTATMVIGNPEISNVLIQHRVEWLTVQAYSPDMANEMATADIAVGAAGGTTWERCCLGLPSVVFTLADNQKDIANALDRAKAAVVIAQDQGLWNRR